ncbi:hypothetical protein J3R82DRAFT_3149 [Butyriboletus roseoflavus]|nr:hypothetical protein J3R82DRAFT_3149 [Butyriboletus roseoflavus]
MYAKFTLFYLVAALVALASASPVPVADPEAFIGNADVIAVSAFRCSVLTFKLTRAIKREPAPVAGDSKRTCSHYAGGCM